MVYFALFGVGKICLLGWKSGIALLLLSFVCAAFVYAGLSQYLRKRRKTSQDQLAIQVKT